jgi:hypothetical protein
MPVQRFKTFEEAEQALWCFSPDARYFSRLRSLFHLAARLRPASPLQGLQKFKSLHEAQSAKPL